MKIYISGKISGLSEKEYKYNFYLADLEVSEQYSWIYKDAKIINPINIKPFLGIRCWLCYMITDLYALRKCTHIAMQRNWIDSRGACVEYFIAKFIFKLDVVFL